MPNSPRDFRGWQSMVERKLREASRQGVQVTAYAVKKAVDEADKNLTATMDLTPAAPVELSWQTVLYRDAGTNFRPRVKVVVDFPEVAIASDGSPIEPGGYELWAREETQSRLVNTIAPNPGATAPGLSFPGQTTYAGVAVGEWARIATSSRPSITAGAFRLNSVWRFRVRSIGANTVKPGLWSAEHVITMVPDDTPPPQPKAPVVTAKLGTLTIKCPAGSVNGAWPGDVDFIRLAQGNSPAPVTEVHRFGRGGGSIVVTDVPYYEPTFFRLQAVDDSGNESPWSEQGVGIVVPLVDTTEMKARIDATTAAIEAARAQTEASGIELSSRLTEAEGALDGARGRLEAAEAAINEAIPASISEARAAAQAAAIEAAAADAQAKADAAEAAAIEAAAADATAKKEEAEANAAAEAARLAQEAADAAQAAAIAAAQEAADAAASGAEQSAIDAANARAAELAEAARAAAVSAAAADATAKAEQAEADATAAAAADATSKADAAKAAAIAAAATDAQTKASAAQQAAITAAAQDAQTKADKAKADAMAAAGRAGDSVLANPGFEFDLTGWTVGAGASIDTTTARTGSKSLKVVGAASARNTVPAAGMVPVVAGQVWEVGVWYKTDAAYNGTSANGKLRIGKQDATQLYAKTFLPNVTAWTYLSQEFTVPAGMTALDIKLVSDHTAGTIWFDDVMARDVTELRAVQKAADDAASAAAAAQSLAGTADSNANLAIQSASGKTSVMRALSVPTGTGKTDGDVWWQYEDNTYKKVIGEWTWSASANPPAWVAQTKSHQTIASVDVGTLTVVGQSKFADVVAQQIAADSGKFIKLDVGQLVVTGTGTLDSAVVENLWTKVVRSRSITTDMLVVGRGENLMPWKVKDATPSVSPHLGNNGGTLSVNTTAPHSGSACMAVAAPSVPAGTSRLTVQLSSGYTTSNGIAGEWNCAKDDQFVFEVWVRTSTTFATAPKLNVEVDYRDLSGNWISASPSASVTGSATWQKISFGFKAPANAASFSLYVAQDQPGTILVDDPFLKPKMAASMIVDGGIMAQHIDASESMNAKLGSFLKVKSDMIEANAVTADKIAVGAITAEKLTSTAIDGKTITGASIVGGSLRLNEVNYTIAVKTDGTGPVVTFDSPTSTTPGTIRCETDGDMVIRSAGTPTKSDRTYFVIQSGKDNLTNNVYTNGKFEIIGAGKGIQLPGAAYINGSGALTITATNSAYLYAGNGGNAVVEVQNVGGYARIVGRQSAADTWAAYLGNTADGAQAGVKTGSNGTSYFNSPLIYALSGTGTANVYTDSGGWLRRSTSAAKYKLALETLAERDDALLSLDAKTWYDRTESEEYADYLSKLYEGEDPASLMDPGPLRRIPGMVAEDVQAAGLEEFVIYGPDGQVEGLMYERLAVALIPVVRRLRDRIVALEWQSAQQKLRMDGLALRADTSEQKVSVLEGTINTLSAALVQLRNDFTAHVKATTTTTSPTTTTKTTTTSTSTKSV